MKLSNILVGVAALATTFANPTGSMQFKLKTVHLSGNHAYNNQFLTTFHTGAGLNVAVLTKNESLASVAQVNGTTIQFALSPGFIVPLGLEPADNAYALWSSVTASVTNTSLAEGFTFNQTTGYLVNADVNSLFDGWRVCRWIYGVPQLFYNIAGHNRTMPANCEKVHFQATSI